MKISLCNAINSFMNRFSKEPKIFDTSVNLSLIIFVMPMEITFFLQTLENETTSNLLGNMLDSISNKTNYFQRCEKEIWDLMN